MPRNESLNGGHWDQSQAEKANPMWRATLLSCKHTYSSGPGCWKAIGYFLSESNEVYVYPGKQYCCYGKTSTLSSLPPGYLGKRLQAESVVWGVIQRGKAVSSGSLTCLLHFDISFSRGSYLLFSAKTCIFPSALGPFYKWFYRLV